MESISISEHDSEKENLPPSPSSRNQEPAPATSKPPAKQIKRTKPKKRKRVYTRKRRVVTRRPLADITGGESSSVQETAAVDSAPETENLPESPPPAAPERALRSSRKRRAVDENDSAPNTKSLRMGFR